MRTLRLVGLSADGSRLVLGDADQRWDLAVDDALVDQVKAARAAAAAVPDAPAQTGAPTPRQVQERIRRGETAADIARTSGLTLEHVARYEGPVLAERAHHARLARLASVGGRQVEELLEEHMQRMAQVGQPLVWDSWLTDSGRWEVLVRCGRVLVRLMWEPAVRRVSAVDEAGRRALGLMPAEQDTLSAVLRPVASRALQAAAPLEALARTQAVGVARGQATVAATPSAAVGPGAPAEASAPTAGPPAASDDAAGTPRSPAPSDVAAGTAAAAARSDAAAGATVPAVGPAAPLGPATSSGPAAVDAPVAPGGPAPVPLSPAATVQAPAAQLVLDDMADSVPATAPRSAGPESGVPGGAGAVAPGPGRRASGSVRASVADRVAAEVVDALVGPGHATHADEVADGEPADSPPLVGTDRSGVTEGVAEQSGGRAVGSDQAAGPAAPPGTSQPGSGTAPAAGADRSGSSPDDALDAAVEAAPAAEPPPRAAPPRPPVGPPRPGSRQGGRSKRASVPTWDDISGVSTGRPGPPRRSSS